jgi:hypothetical protein
MISFRTSDEEAMLAQRWAESLGIDKSELLRIALHKHLVRLAAENDIDAWQKTPMTPEEKTLNEIAAWGPSEDFSDWLDATR